MSDFELRMARTPLPEPPPGLRPAMLARAGRERRWRTVERAWRWSLVVAAGLLLVLNLHFSRVHEHEMIALIGPPGVERPLEAKVFVQSLEHRRHVLTAACSGDFPSALKEDLL